MARLIFLVTHRYEYTEKDNHSIGFAKFCKALCATNITIGNSDHLYTLVPIIETDEEAFRQAFRNFAPEITRHLKSWFGFNDTKIEWFDDLSLVANYTVIEDTDVTWSEPMLSNFLATTTVGDLFRIMQHRRKGR